MNREMKMVTEFHRRHEFAIGREIKPVSPDGLNYVVEKLSRRVRNEARHLASSADLPTQRASLILEESGEVVEALANGDAVELADGLADLMYVVIGTAVAFGLPLDRLFDEVHRSNMTKPLRAGDLHPPKGDGYSPPRIQEVLDGNA